MVTKVVRNEGKDHTWLKVFGPMLKNSLERIAVCFNGDKERGNTQNVEETPGQSGPLVKEYKKFLFDWKKRGENSKV